jgi:hypothetical protein
MLAGLAMAYYGCAGVARRCRRNPDWHRRRIGFLANGIAALPMVFLLALVLPAINRAWRSRNYAALAIAAATAAPWP